MLKRFKRLHKHNTESKIFVNMNIWKIKFKPDLSCLVKWYFQLYRCIIFYNLGLGRTIPTIICIRFLFLFTGDHTVLVRACVVDNGGVNSETEIGRISHCWLVRKIIYMDHMMTGCSVSCDTDGCNSAPASSTPLSLKTLCTLAFGLLLMKHGLKLISGGW